MRKPIDKDSLRSRPSKTKSSSKMAEPAIGKSIRSRFSNGRNNEVISTMDVTSQLINETALKNPKSKPLSKTID